MNIDVKWWAADKIDINFQNWSLYRLTMHKLTQSKLIYCRSTYKYRRVDLLNYTRCSEILMSTTRYSSKIINMSINRKMII